MLEKVLVLLVALLVAAPSAAAAQTRSATYVAVPGVGLTHVSGTSWIGGAEFPADNLFPTLVQVSDAAGGPVDILVCQDLNFDNSCSGPQDVRKRACATAINLVGEGFKADKKTVVLIGAASPACPHVPTTGTIKLTTA